MAKILITEFAILTIHGYETRSASQGSGLFNKLRLQTFNIIIAETYVIATYGCKKHWALLEWTFLTIYGKKLHYVSLIWAGTLDYFDLKPIAPFEVTAGRQYLIGYFILFRGIH